MLFVVGLSFRTAQLSEGEAFFGDDGLMMRQLLLAKEEVQEGDYLNLQQG